MVLEPVAISGSPKEADMGPFVPEVCEGGWEESVAHPKPPAMFVPRATSDPSDAMEEHFLKACSVGTNSSDNKLRSMLDWTRCY
ncbi:hypothetical protein Nepgr_028791 [Nepenthes gracilis]|uniref:Uncharacterized protein n=1 Tax=Nepenthes gracilis TaxID=150966 RepID=A0AAD3TCZ4_NEPGR|nr:hypothetical protein Nepgr_028791 [Nepenthes gracilis]